MTHCLIIAGAATGHHQLVSLLQAYGFEVERSGSPEEALQACRQRMPDLILMPDAMGSMTSVTFLQHLDRTARGTSPAVLICAQEASAASIGQAIWEGAAECLIQPFDADILDFKLRQVGVTRSGVAA